MRKIHQGKKPVPARPRSSSPGVLLWRLIEASHPKTIRRLEKLAGETQANVVDSMIEESWWGDYLPEFVGRKGAAAERRAELIAARHSFLTPRPNAPVFHDEITDDDIPF